MEKSVRPIPRSALGALFHPWTWRMAWRDARPQRTRMLWFVASVVIGVASLTAIHALGEAVKSGIATQSKELLGADLLISSKQPIGADERGRLSGMAEEISSETTFPTMLRFANGGARMVQVRGIDGGFPFYGSVLTNPPQAWEEWKQGGGVLLEPALLDQFGVNPGDTVDFGTVKLKVLGSLVKSAPRASRFSGFAPEACVRAEDVGRSGLLARNSLATHNLYLRIENPPAPERLKNRVKNRFPQAPWRLETPEDRKENLGDALDNFQRFLGILGLAALVLGAIGVASAVREHVARRVPAVAVLRCLGCPGNAAFAVFFIQALAMGLLGAVLGGLLGLTLQSAVIALFREQLPLALDAAPQWLVGARTMAAGFAVCCGFAVPPMLAVRAVSPVATLRQGVAARGNHLVSLPIYAVLAGILVWLARASGGDTKRAFALVAGLAAAFFLLLLVAKLVIALTQGIRGKRWPFVFRLGISHLHRPRNQTLLFLLSLGLGTFLLLTVWLAGRMIQQKVDLTHHAESPNLYLIDVQPDQREGVRAIVEKQGLPVLEDAPMVTMRVSAIRGTPVREVKDLPGWIARREFRSTWREAMNSTEKLIAGEWHASVIPGESVPLSLEEEVAKDMKVSVGDGITLDVQGVTVEARVTSLRKVDWSRFNLNFFMVFPPGVLEDAPGFHVVTTRAPDAAASGNLQKSLAAEFANVTAIDLAVILKSVREMLGKISWVVSLLAGFTLLAGIPVIAGALANGRDARVRESTLLRALGASGRQTRAILLVEYAALGFLSAFCGVVLAIAAQVALAMFVFDVSPIPPLGPPLIAFVSATAIAVIGGLLIGRGINRKPPLETLREG